MSAVKILVSHQEDGFSKIYIDGKYCGKLEDMGDSGFSVKNVLESIIKLGALDNIEVDEK